MALEELLGPKGFNLIEFPSDSLQKVLSDYLPVEFRVWELLVANIAEFAISSHAKPGVEAPYPVDPDMATYITHKSNTLTYTCPPHRHAHRSSRNTSSCLQATAGSFVKFSARNR